MVCGISILDQVDKEVAGATFIHIQSVKQRREHILLWYASANGYGVRLIWSGVYITYFPSGGC